MSINKQKTKGKKVFSSKDCIKLKIRHGLTNVNIGEAEIELNEKDDLDNAYTDRFLEKDSDLLLQMQQETYKVVNDKVNLDSESSFNKELFQLVQTIQEMQIDPEANYDFLMAEKEKVFKAMNRENDSNGDSLLNKDSLQFVQAVHGMRLRSELDQDSSMDEGLEFNFSDHVTNDKVQNFLNHPEFLDSVGFLDENEDENNENEDENEGVEKEELSLNQRRKLNKKLHKGKKEARREKTEEFGEKQELLAEEIKFMKDMKAPIYKSVYLLNEMNEIDKQLRKLCTTPGKELTLYPMLKEFRSIIRDLIGRYKLDYTLKGKEFNKYLCIYSKKQSEFSIANEVKIKESEYKELPLQVKDFSATLINLLKEYHNKYIKSIMRDNDNKDIDLSFKAIKFISNRSIFNNPMSNNSMYYDQMHNNPAFNLHICNISNFIQLGSNIMEGKHKHGNVIFEDVPPIEENNIGFKLLSKMGYDKNKSKSKLGTNPEVKYRNKGVGLGYSLDA
ncbi:hypothetical protein K502DRAFT_342573 [Neoconidiobolus thromboides FSU 785]|nr:hypothetical protein K502DRAFT_342573 [Neoconidiobolus thromboides FSU 785]